MVTHRSSSSSPVNVLHGVRNITTATKLCFFLPKPPYPSRKKVRTMVYSFDMRHPQVSYGEHNLYRWQGRYLSSLTILRLRLPSVPRDHGEMNGLERALRTTFSNLMHSCRLVASSSSSSSSSRRIGSSSIIIVVVIDWSSAVVRGCISSMKTWKLIDCQKHMGFWHQVTWLWRCGVLLPRMYPLG